MSCITRVGDEFKCGCQLYDFLEIVPEYDRCTEATVYYLWGYGEYRSPSVLAGQYKQHRLDGDHDLEALKQRIGFAVPIRTDGSLNFPSSMFAGLAATEPDWFDEADAGEHWDEDY